MPKQKTGGRLRVSRTQPQLFLQKDRAETEVKYFGLLRDEALGDLTSNDEALAGVLKDIQDPAEASTLGNFEPPDIQILDGIFRFGLKREDFEVLSGASINALDEQGVSAPLVSPRQRIADRITQAEGFAGRGTIYQGQGSVLFKYYVPADQPTGSTNKYSHTNLPPFFTEAITSTAFNSADFVPLTDTQIAETHRVGYVKDGAFVPDVENEYWWSGEYNYDFLSASEYGDQTESALTNPKFPIVRDGNMRFDQIPLRGINTKYNWGLRFDMWMAKGAISGTTLRRLSAQVNGHIRVDYFDKSGYNPTTGAVEGTWRTAVNTADPSTYYVQVSKEAAAPNALGSQIHYIQGGPTMPLGSGTGTLPAQRSLADGSAFDFSKTYSDREGNPVSNFDGDYVPVVVRFWYGQPSTDPAQTNILTNKPLGPAGFFIQSVETNINPVDLPSWNDYSSQLRVTWSTAQSAWEVDTSAGGSAAAEANFVNFSEFFEIVGYTFIGAPQPGSVLGYNAPSALTIATKTDPVLGVTYSQFSISGLSPTDGQKIWVLVKNRPRTVIPTTELRYDEPLWQRFLFNPNQTGKYKSVYDMLDGVGANFVNPDPSKVPFEQNLGLYKAKFGNLPELNTYGTDRYDGMLPNSITTAAAQRDYDYNHSKLLMIGRQRKGTVAEIGTTAPYSGKNLVPGEVRKDGANYTFMEVIENQAGFGGNVIITGFPTNDLGVIDTATLTNYGKALHMADNSTTFSNISRQNISTLTPTKLPSDPDFDPGTIRVLYEEVDGQGRFSYGSWDGSAFTYDATGVVAQLALGGSVRNHLSKSAFTVAFRKGTTDYSFYGLIGAQRTSFASVTLTVNSGDTTITTSGGVFSPDSAGSNNSQYIGSEIYFAGDATVRRVTSYDASTGRVTFTPSKPTGVYSNCEVYYNHFQLGGTLPSFITDSSGARVSRAGVIPSPTGGNVADRLVQIKLVMNGAYQYLRADQGAGLSFGETLYVKASSSPSPGSPFSPDTELPAPPADIVVPFGYDNTPGSSDPGLGGLCYPPYSIQNIDLQGLVKTDDVLYDSVLTPEGNFDVWWGGRISNVTDMGQKFLHVTDKLMFDFSVDERANLLSTLLASQKPVFTGAEYTHKLEVELGVGPITDSATAINANIYNDARLHSNNKPVKDKYYLFIQKQEGGQQLRVLSANNPSWT